MESVKLEKKLRALKNAEKLSNWEHMNGYIGNDSNNYSLNLYNLYNFAFHTYYLINPYFLII